MDPARRHRVRRSFARDATKRGRIGGEMFYGRDAERKSILDPRGTQVLYGGRGLGKSALLADAGELFTEQRPGYHQTVYVNLDQENIGKGSSRAGRRRCGASS
ncbi:hypothetical protein [Streptomyces sp. NPDC017890]|uniref:hypothetical protein n=1 Tax=Streptomyces sp. NPDC017890 TaxID=3365015 RepID=UPI00379ACC35